MSLRGMHCSQMARPPDLMRLQEGRYCTQAGQSLYMDMSQVSRMPCALTISYNYCTVGSSCLQVLQKRVKVQ